MSSTSDPGALAALYPDEVKALVTHDELPVICHIEAVPIGRAEPRLQIYVVEGLLVVAPLDRPCDLVKLENVPLVDANLACQAVIEDVVLVPHECGFDGLNDL